jgi:hypothetical protein
LKLAGALVRSAGCESDQDACPRAGALPWPADGRPQESERRSRQAREAQEDLKEGKVKIEQILGNPPEYVSTAKVIDILMAVPKFGRVKAARFLNTCRISQSKTVGGLSDRQRTELIGLFNSR